MEGGRLQGQGLPRSPSRNAVLSRQARLAEGVGSRKDKRAADLNPFILRRALRGSLGGMEKGEVQQHVGEDTNSSSRLSLLGSLRSCCKEGEH